MDRHAAYEEDFFAWTQEQARLLREAAAVRVNAPVDWENVAEEVESVGKRDRRAVANDLLRVIEHLLKLEFSPAEAPRAGWRRSVREHRRRVLQALDDSPSLRASMDLAAAYRGAREDAADRLEPDRIDPAMLPDACPYTAGQVLDEGWWPMNRHGVEG